jgi:hypothetical protein
MKLTTASSRISFCHASVRRNDVAITGNYTRREIKKVIRSQMLIFLMHSPHSAAPFMSMSSTVVDECIAHA